MDFKEFQKKVNDTKFGFLFYLIPIVLLSVLFYMVAGCFFVILVALAAIAIPYYMGFRGPKRFAFLGVFVLIANSFAFGGVNTYHAYDYANYWESFESWSKYVEPQSSPDNMLSQGVVTPKSGDPGTEFTFKVVYTSDDDIPPLFIRAVVSDNLIEEPGEKIVLTMTATDPSDTNYTNGAEFEVNATLPDEVVFPEFPNHFFFFESRDENNTYADTAFRDDNTTSYGMGPMNAPLAEAYWVNTIWAFYNMLFVIVLFYLGVGMYWWLRQARARSTQWQERMETMQREEYTEFECDRCGADVPEDADKCPKCGATFDEEEEEPEDEEEE